VEVLPDDIVCLLWTTAEPKDAAQLSTASRRLRQLYDKHYEYSCHRIGIFRIDSVFAYAQLFNVASRPRIVASESQIAMSEIVRISCALRAYRISYGMAALRFAP
jgi:hypothetical protein